VLQAKLCREDLGILVLRIETFRVVSINVISGHAFMNNAFAELAGYIGDTADGTAVFPGLARNAQICRVRASTTALEICLRVDTFPSAGASAGDIACCQSLATVVASDFAFRNGTRAALEGAAFPVAFLVRSSANALRGLAGRVRGVTVLAGVEAGSAALARWD